MIVFNKFKIGRGYTNLNTETEVVTGTFTVVIIINYHGDYV